MAGFIPLAAEALESAEAGELLSAGKDIDELTTEEINFSSTALASGTYDFTNGDLTISFTDGGVHDYSGVPLRVWEGLKGAGSKGQYFNSFIRNSY